MGIISREVWAKTADSPLANGFLSSEKRPWLVKYLRFVIHSYRCIAYVQDGLATD